MGMIVIAVQRMRVVRVRAAPKRDFVGSLCKFFGFHLFSLGNFKIIKLIHAHVAYFPDTNECLCI